MFTALEFVQRLRGFVAYQPVDTPPSKAQWIKICNDLSDVIVSPTPLPFHILARGQQILSENPRAPDTTYDFNTPIKNDTV